MYRPFLPPPLIELALSEQVITVFRESVHLCVSHIIRLNETTMTTKHGEIQISTMKKVICQLLSFLLTLVSYAQSVTISPATSGNQTLNSDGINVRLNAKLGTVGNPTNGNLIFQCCGYDNGRVGVGLSSPLSTFHIQDDYASNTTLRLSASSAAGTVKGLELAVDGNLGTKTVFFNQLENAPFKFTINNTTRMSILETGKVGIGNIIPLASLHLQAPNEQNTTLRLSSNAAATGQADGLEIGSGAFVSGGVSSYITNADPGGTLFYNAGNQVFRSSNVSSPTMTVRVGRVGIGSMNNIAGVPMAKLEVNGDFALSRKVTLSGGISHDNFDRQGASIISVASSGLGGGVETLTGIAEGTEGMILYVYPVQGTTLTIANENLSSSDRNRIITHTAGNVTIVNNGGATLLYDGTAQRWRIISIAN